MTRIGLLSEPAGYIEGTNLYEYVGDNPEGYIDPLGEQSAPTTQPTSQPTTQPITVQVLGGKMFFIVYTGNGTPTFLQTVQISADPTCGCKVPQSETSEHGGHGHDPTTQPVGDNESGDPTKPFDTGPNGNRLPGAGSNGGMLQSPNIMHDQPSFPSPPYDTNFCGTKTFVTTVLGPDGTPVAQVKWHVTKAPDGTTTITIDSK
jgi:hypothetical protein